eukprot:11980161-Prorocentrum_lima.AAC.1
MVEKTRAQWDCSDASATMSAWAWVQARRSARRSLVRVGEALRMELKRKNSLMPTSLPGAWDGRVSQKEWE